MRAIAFPASLIVAAIVLLVVYSSTFIVSEREQAIQLRFGEIQRVITEPGIYFKVPTNTVDTVQIIDKRLLAIELSDKVVQVNDGRRYVVDVFSTFRITDPRRFRESVSGNLSLAAERLRTRLDAALRRVYGLRSFDAALSSERAEMMVELRDLVRTEAEGLGMNIVDVRIRRTDLVPEVSQQTFERMRAERLAEAAELRAQGTQEALRIRAEADRQATVLVAEAARDAEILRGEGDAERSRIFAEAYTLDPSFFEFYRSMQAYGQAMGENTGTTMVLSPDNDFFRYFNGAGETAVRPAPPAAPGPGATAPDVGAPGAPPPASTAAAPDAPAPAAPPPATAAQAPAAPTAATP
ncbi:protease modulator HflC [Chthonobacter rhizosphaerae]|uniref:protease modulator HflC n=1 Tax=Chthonobacter rhizosphaerae TaxID=2735553 RepID=UPI0015EF7C16|nr:protease modulator HflC [Chthonobacter rhizosphaerae]